MKLQEFEKSLNVDPPTQAAEFLLWIPPTGSAVECPDIDTAGDYAKKWAATHPGKMIAVYQRVGFAFVPVREPEFITGKPAQIESSDGG